MSLTGMLLLQDVAERILARWMEERGRVDVRSTEGRESLGGRAVDLSYAWQGGRRLIKVKPDPYFGNDPVKISNREFAFYRPDSAAFAFEAVANTATKEPGWVAESPADDVYYYYIAIAQSEAEVRALMGEPDAVFFSELAVDRDDLVIMPMNETRRWFAKSYQKYTSRPVTVAGSSSWVRVVPRADFESGVPASSNIGPVFRTLT